MTNKELGMLFLKNYPVDSNGFSEVALMEDLILLAPEFKTTNGCQWARSDQSWLGRQFKIERILKRGRVYSVQLVGFNNDISNHSIPNTVKDIFSNQKCVILDIGTNIEIDHKNGRYDSEQYTENDFQPLSKTANDAKRQHCKDCKKNKMRYDARILGFSAPFTKGDFTSDFCEGCYWYDPKEFCRIISANFKINNEEKM